MKFFVLSFFLSTNLIAFEHLDRGIWVERNSSSSSQGPRIAIATAIIQENQDLNQGELSYGEQVAFGTKSKLIYAKKQGYDFFLATKRLEECYGIKAERSLEASWSKIPLVAQLLEEYDWVFWTDADSLILNFDIRLESFLDDRYDLIGCTEKETLKVPCHYCPEIDYVNMGQFFIRNSSVGRGILLGAWKNHLPPSWLYEQPWMNWHIIENHLEDQVLVCPHHTFNSHPSRYKEGDFLIHTFGHRGQDRQQAFQLFEQQFGYILEEEERKILQQAK